MSFINGEYKATIGDALLSLVPNAEWNVRGDVIQWIGPGTQPSDSDIATERSRLETEYTNNKYQRDRKVKYPDIGDQLDNLYKDILAGKVDSTGEFAKAIKAVKDSIPKP